MQATQENLGAAENGTSPILSGGIIPFDHTNHGTANNGTARTGLLRKFFDWHAVNREHSRFRTMWLAVILLLVILAFSSVVLLRIALLEQEQTKRSAAFLARDTIRSIDTELRNADALLRGLSTSRDLAGHNYREFHSQLLATWQPAGTWMGVFDPAGNEVVNTLSPFGTELSNAELKNPKFAEAWRLVKSGKVVFAGRLATSLDDFSGVAFPVVQDGVFRHGLYYSISLRRVQSLVARQNVPEGWVLTLADKRGELLTRIPASTKPTSDITIVNAPHSELTGWQASVSIPSAVLNAPIRRAIARIAWIAALFLVVGLPMIWLIERPFLRLSARLKQSLKQAKSVEEGYTIYWSGASDGLFIVRPTADGLSFESVNPAFETQTGLTKSQVEGRPLQLAEFQPIGDFLAARCTECIQADESVVFTGAVDTNAGRRHWRSGLSPLKDEQGAITLLLGNIHDFTEQVSAFNLAKASQMLLQDAIDAIESRVAVLDGSGLIVATNAAWREPRKRAGDYREGEEVGSSYLSWAYRTLPEINHPQLRRGVAALISGQTARFTLPYVVAASDGLAWRRLSLSRFHHEHNTHIIAFNEDVTEVVQAQSDLRQTTEELAVAQEKERERIGVELHDSTGQHMVALSLGIAKMKRQISHIDGIEPVIEDMEASVTAALREIRVLSYLLHPPELDREGFVDATHRYVAGFGSRTGLNFTFDAVGDLDRLSNEVQHVTFRIVQESLSNVYKHAAARNIKVHLRESDGELELGVADDGCGMPSATNPDSHEPPMGVGIPGMQTRVSQLGGTMTITSTADGTVLNATFPKARRGVSRLALEKGGRLMNRTAATDR